MDFLMCLSPFNGAELGVNITTVWLTFNPCTVPCLAPLWHFRRSRRVLVNCLSPRQSINHREGVTTGRRVSVSVCRRGSGGVCVPDFQDIKGPTLSPSFPRIGYIWSPWAVNYNYGLGLSLVSEAKCAYIEVIIGKRKHMYKCMWRENNNFIMFEKLVMRQSFKK